MNFFSFLRIFAFFVIEVTAQSEKCPPLFMRYSQEHTYCKPTNPECNILKSFVTPSDIAVILKQHNILRSKIATGKEQKLPSASNMLQMVWDDELAAVAQKHANQCEFEHDCSNCRRVQNFGVGQNLATESITNSPKLPEPNWPRAIKSWYDEVTYFSRNIINPYVSSYGPTTYGHFSQVIWADSWRVGCGYVLYRERNTYTGLYTCNYGPGGNIIQKSVYKEGPTCSACPVNSCCDKTCGGTAEYPGLCKITDNRGPSYKPQSSYIFYCDFQNQNDCKSEVIGKNKWLTYNTLSGNYLGIVLKGGEESTTIFNKLVQPSTSSFCFVTNYRKGPNVDGQEDNSKATETFTIVRDNFKVTQDLPQYSGAVKQQFSQFSMSLSWNMETEFKVTFSVPPGKPDQFFEIQNIYAKEGRC